MKIEIDESAAKKALEGLVHEIDISKGYGE